MNLTAYFERINDDSPRAADLESLRRIHRAHLLAVPFENLSIHIGQSIQLDETWLFDKIVHQRRGGFCYEQNGLFAAILRELGYDVTLIEARVPDSEGGLGIRFDHLALIVKLENEKEDQERWLVDVGFGDSFLDPLRLDDPEPQMQDDGKAYRVQHDGLTGIYSRDEVVQYHFDLQPRQLSDFSAACLYHQTSPDSHFTQKRVCSLPTSNGKGRMTLSGDKLIIRQSDLRREVKLYDEEDISEALNQYFNIQL